MLPAELDQAHRRTLVVASVLMVLLHVWHALGQGGGGWNKRHDGLAGAIAAFFRLSGEDPVLSAGLSDFLVTAGVFGTLAVGGLPPAQRRHPRTLAWVVLFSVFPGLGALLAPLWLRPRG